MRHVLIALAIAGCGGHSGAKPDAAANHPLTREDLARACVNGYACIAPPVDAATLPSCLRHLDDGGVVISMYRTEQIRCLVAAGSDCTRARACLGYSYGACSPDGFHCDGDRSVECIQGKGFSLDCHGGLWYPSDAMCVPASPSACGIGVCAAGSPARCDGTRGVMCQNGVLSVFDCAQLGMACAVNGATATCIGTGAACTASRCEGTTLVRCEGGHETRHDCAAMLDGGSCLNYGRDGASCGFGPDCGGTATCSGNTTTVCVLGAEVSLDCVASGFAACGMGSCVPATFP
jgi:hypothetical protein